MVNHMTKIWVNGTAIKTPSPFSWRLQDVSDSASGRTQDTIMHKKQGRAEKEIHCMTMDDLQYL